MEKYVTQKLAGWGRLPVEVCHVYRPERRRGVWEAFGSREQATYLARGLGRSYGDTALNTLGGVIDISRLDRMIDFDPESGVLACEGGVSLAAILDAFVPRGYFLPVTPGTKFVTVGGAIANDVHGKNHHRDGAFGNFVVDFALLTPNGEVVTCSPTEHEDLFWATVGGVGLTGIILTARIQLRRVETAYIRVDYRRAPDLDTSLALMAELDPCYPYSVAWVDCLAQGRDLGRSVLMFGDHARLNDMPFSRGMHPLRLRGACAKSVPADLPGFVLNPWTVRAFNEVFYRFHPNAEGKLVDYDRYFYPLDSVHHWNRMYGRGGFVQFQATIPDSNARALTRLLEAVSQSSRASFLAVLKRFGATGQGLLSYPSPGYTLALDIPNHRGLRPFMDELHGLVAEAGGRIYLAKDACAPASVFSAMYPGLDRFREIQRRVDPEGRLSSTLARRLGITGARGGQW